jgi:hypothetical protein
VSSTEYYGKGANRILAVRYPSSVLWTKVGDDYAPAHPMFKYTYTEFDSMINTEGWKSSTDVANPQRNKLQELHGITKLYKVKGESYGILTITLANKVHWVKTREDNPVGQWTTITKEDFDSQWSDKLEEDKGTFFTYYGGEIV